MFRENLGRKGSSAETLDNKNWAAKTGMDLNPQIARLDHRDLADVFGRNLQPPLGWPDLGA